MAGIQWGNVPYNEELPYYEFCGNGGITWNVATSSNQTFLVNNVTMPWYGKLTATVYLCINWSNMQQVTATLSPSSPAPSLYNNQTLLLSDPTIFGPCCCSATWNGVGAGAVSVYCNLSTGSGNQTITANYIGYTFRAHRL